MLKAWRSHPGAILVSYLSILYVLAIWLKAGDSTFYGEARRVGGLALGFLFPQLLAGVIGGIKPRIDNLWITMVILMLLSDPGTSVVMMVALGLITCVIKTIGRVGGQPVFNPAAAGLFISSFFGVGVSWWGVSFAPRLPILGISSAMFLTLPVGLYLIALYKKVPTLVSVPLVFMVSYFLIKGRLPFVTLLEGTFGFFLLIMATEPKTTPVIDWEEWLFGGILGGVLAWLMISRILGEPYLASLLGINLVFAGFKQLYVRVIMKR